MGSRDRRATVDPRHLVTAAAPCSADRGRCRNGSRLDPATARAGARRHALEREVGTPWQAHAFEAILARIVELQHGRGFYTTARRQANVSAGQSGAGAPAASVQRSGVDSDD